MGFHHPARLFRRVGINNCSGALLCFSKSCWIKGKRFNMCHGSRHSFGSNQSSLGVRRGVSKYSTLKSHGT